MNNTAKREARLQISGVAQITAFLEKRITIREIIFLLLALFCLTPWASPPLALFLGLIAAQVTGNPFRKNSHTITSTLLQASVVGLGFGINFQSALNVGREGMLLTVASIAGTLLIGGLAGKFLGIEKKTSWLIASGTAICGGSAIAAIAPVIDADEQQTSVALGTIFILNAVALFLFPEAGAMLHMTQKQFGLWAAIAIHDTSSVVGAASRYGDEALRIATTVKLARSLWIIPVAVITALFFRQKVHEIKVPWFIGLFVAAMLVHTYLPALRPFTLLMAPAAKTGLTVTLFLIGAGLSREVLKNTGWKPLLQGTLTWIAISIASLLTVLFTS